MVDCTKLAAVVAMIAADEKCFRHLVIDRVSVQAAWPPWPRFLPQSPVVLSIGESPLEGVRFRP